MDFMDRLWVSACKEGIEDLTGIWKYTAAKWSEQQADRYYKQLLNACQGIANDPDAGKNYDEIADNLFGLKTNRHIIFYRKRMNRPIEITRILRERMGLESRLIE